MSRELAEAVRACFEPAYLAEPANAAWRSALLGNGAAVKPVDAQVLLLMQAAVKARAEAGGAAAVIAAVDAWGAELGLTLVEVFGRKCIGVAARADERAGAAATGAGAPAVAAAAPQAADGADTPDARTVFASPIHFRATEAEIAAFFAQWGAVAAVARRRFVERGVAKLRPSVFVMFATKRDAEHCAASRPSYGECATALASMWVPRLTVTLKGHPLCRDALADEEAKAGGGAQGQGQGQGQPHADAAADNAAATHRRLLERGRVCVARGVAADVPQGEVHSRLGSIRGATDAIDIVFMPPAAGAAVGAGKVAFVYCTSRAAATTLLSCYGRVFSANEPYGAALSKAVPQLELCRDDEEELAMQLYPEAVAARTQKKMERNAKRRQRDDDGK